MVTLPSLTTIVSPGFRERGSFLVGKNASNWPVTKVTRVSESQSETLNVVLHDESVSVDKCTRNCWSDVLYVQRAISKSASPCNQTALGFSSVHWCA